ncbi:hypothetical protein HI031_01185 [Staphylococcus haemolyticus]|nr:hypothetical protein HI031_01185 [Staphylococcus haemolyticus]
MTGNTGNGCVKCGQTITCKNCGYTEFYKTNNNRTSDIVDLFFGG